MTDMERIITTAADLMGDAENPEYDRALAELTCELLGISTEHKYEVLAFIRTVANPGL